MYREIEIEVDATSWVGAVPQELAALGSNPSVRRRNVYAALLHTALWTRPPAVQGFSLADYWAWLRYGPAIAANTLELRLRAEWEEIDPHQKTILSDELAVGFSAELLATELGFARFVDTLHFIRVVAPGSLEFVARSRIGPTKSPDYIAIDAGDRINVLEFKGTQSSRRALSSAIIRGRRQKENVRSGSSVVHWSLVMGFFIPQAWSQESAQLRIVDPQWAGLVKILEEVPVDLLLRAAVQVELAKELALLGLAESAAFFAKTATADLGEIPPLVREELVSLPVIDPVEGARGLAIEPPPRLRAEGREDGISIRRFEAAFSGEVYKLLLASGSALDVLNFLGRRREWRMEQREGKVTLEAPSGFRIALAFED